MYVLLWNLVVSRLAGFCNNMANGRFKGQRDHVQLHSLLKDVASARIAECPKGRFEPWMKISDA